MTDAPLQPIINLIYLITGGYVGTVLLLTAIGLYLNYQNNQRLERLERKIMGNGELKQLCEEEGITYLEMNDD